MSAKKFATNSSGGGGGGTGAYSTDLEFELSGWGGRFAPYYHPEDVSVNKSRKLSRQSAFCDGELVSDTGSENREIMVNGYLVGFELFRFNRLIEAGKKMQLVALPWSGEVLLDDSNIHGPIGIDSFIDAPVYEYDLDLVSSGKNEEGMENKGIIS